jgi:hypothetical protein
MVFYYLPFIGICLRSLSWTLAAERINKLIPKLFCKVATELSFWFLSSRIIFYIINVRNAAFAMTSTDIFHWEDFKVIRSFPNTMVRIGWNDLVSYGKIP